MTAQQQLVELLNDDAQSGADAGDCAQFIRDHGQAIAELIEAVSAVKACLTEPSLSEPYSEARIFANHPMFAAISNLTEPQ